MNKNIEKAIQIVGAGQTGLAHAIGDKCRQGHVYQWLNDLKIPSPYYSKRIAEVTFGKVPAGLFHPEIFGDVADSDLVPENVPHE